MIRKIFIIPLLLATVFASQVETIRDPWTAVEHYPLPKKNLKGVDKFCTVSNTFGDVCTIKAKFIHLTYDQIYESKYSIVFDNSQVNCVTTSGKPCDIILEL